MHVSAAAATVFVFPPTDEAGNCTGLFSEDRSLAQFAASMLQVSSIRVFGLEALVRTEAERRTLDACAAQRGATIAAEDPAWLSYTPEVRDTVIVRFQLLCKSVCVSMCTRNA